MTDSQEKNMGQAPIVTAEGGGDPQEMGTQDCTRNRPAPWKSEGPGEAGVQDPGCTGAGASGALASGGC